jgi:hypothetical protein
MPEPSNDPINTDDPKYANAAQVKDRENVPFRGEVVTVEDQFRDKAQRLKRVAEIPAGNTLEISEPTETRGW